MPVTSITQALAASGRDDTLVRHFQGVWPVIESMLGAFSKATRLPTFVFFEGTHVFQSSVETMPPFCLNMLGSPETEKMCIGDGVRRASGGEPGLHGGVQMCHAGMLNGRREIETGVGTLTILFGSRKAGDSEADGRRQRVIERVGEGDAELAGRLAEAASSDASSGDFEPTDMALMDAITDMLQRFVNATAGFRLLTINMAHELSIMMINLGLLTRAAGGMFSAYKGMPAGEQAERLSERLSDSLDIIDMQCRLGLYIVRNFFSHTSETRYSEVVKPRFSDVNLEELLKETLKLHRLSAAEKNVSFDFSVSPLPVIRGFDMELRRLFSNVLNNAIKYSYHSVPNTRRIIRIKSKMPFDPGFKRPRFSVTFENYGLGLTEEERRNVFKPGFRGKQAIAEVPIGSGIGLSEADKIMKLHGGSIRFQSKELHRAGESDRTYLTTVDLIFPYSPDRSAR